MRLEVEDLHVHYGRIHALRGVSLSVGDAEIVAVLGANGAGKSSLLRAIMGLAPVSAGRVALDGVDITDWPPHRRVRCNLSLVPEGRRIIMSLTIHENLLMGAFARHDAHTIKPEVDAVYGRFSNLAARRHMAASVLSGGEQQMLAIARALMTNPELLILDEATEGLAPIIRQEIWKVLGKLKASGQSILIVDKNVQVLARLADRHYVLERGRVRWRGSSAALGADLDAIRRYVGV